jgi:hypothetical protein
MTSQAALERIAARVIWWQRPEVSLGNVPRFLMQVMTLGSWSEVQEAREAFGEEAMRNALVNAEPGVFDGKSWTYWHVVFGLSEPLLPGSSLK